ELGDLGPVDDLGAEVGGGGTAPEGGWSRTVPGATPEAPAAPPSTAAEAPGEPEPVVEPILDQGAANETGASEEPSVEPEPELAVGLEPEPELVVELEEDSEPVAEPEPEPLEREQGSEPLE